MATGNKRAADGTKKTSQETNSDEATSESFRGDSPVWCWFPRSNDEHLLCTLCDTKVARCGGSSTRGLLAHLTVFHKIEKEKLSTAAAKISDMMSKQYKSKTDGTPPLKSFLARRNPLVTKA